ncbi:MAG: type II secretion system protein [Anaerohalosphaera sp.]|nr:type II secretion system protein [Anaerohalosphaera sp.]
MDISSKNRVYSGLTLTEMVIALAIVGFIFAAVLPQFLLATKSWDGRAGDAEAMQNGRVLMSHINANLSQAKKITAVSASGVTNGYIEFEDAVGSVFRYEIGPDGYVRFGEVGSVADLAGPVSQLQFTCYGLADMDNATVDVSVIRVIKVDTVFVNAAEAREDMSFSAEVFIQVGSGGSSGLTKESTLEFDTSYGKYPAIAEVGAGYFLCAYRGNGGDGWAKLLYVNDATWDISVRAAYEFDKKNCSYPALVQIDQSHYLCAYTGDKNDGWAVILTVNVGSGSISKGTAYEFDKKNGETPALARIDDEHYLCAYEGNKDDGWAVVLSVNVGSGTISKGTAFEFDKKKGKDPILSPIDNEHYLCAYEGDKDDGWAVVLSVNAGSGSISKGTSFEFDSSNGETPSLAKIDNEHYVCAYEGNSDDGWATVLMVNPSTWRVSRGLKYEFDATKGKIPVLTQIDDGRYLCMYVGDRDDGWAKILTVNSGTWGVGEGSSLEYDTIKGKYPALSQIDEDHWLCVYTGDKDDGWAAVISNGGGVEP